MDNSGALMAFAMYALIGIVVFICCMIILRWILGTAELIRLSKENNNLTNECANRILLGSGETNRLLKENTEKMEELLQIFRKAKINSKTPTV